MLYAAMAFATVFRCICHVFAVRIVLVAVCIVVVVLVAMNIVVVLVAVSIFAVMVVRCCMVWIFMTIVVQRL